MNRRDFLKTLCIAAPSTIPFASCVQSTKKPNIIYIMADDLGYGDLSCYGQQKFKTPSLDRMAAEGKIFTQRYSGSTVCAPSRCSLLTGVHTGHCLVRGNKEYEPEGQHPLPADTRTIAKILQKAGYKTGATGKWGLGGPGSVGEPNRQGFDYWYGYLCQRQAHFYYQDHLWENTNRVDIPENSDSKKETFIHDLITNKALSFIKANRSNPFFLYVPFTIPHAELAVPEDDLNKFQGVYPETPYEGEHYGNHKTPHAAFAGMVTRMDRDVGKILDLLVELKIDKDTIVTFTSDNGPHKEGGHDPWFFNSNGPLRGEKRDLYERGIRVPFIAWWPGKIQAGTKTDHISAFWDFLPTACEVAGLDSPIDIDGKSYLPSMIGDEGAQKEHEFLYWEFYEGGSKQAVRFGDWKAVRFNERGTADGPVELYNLKSDLGEEKNIANLHPDLVTKATRYMQQAHSENEFWKLEG
jgi:arylsulfatase A